MSLNIVIIDTNFELKQHTLEFDKDEIDDEKINTTLNTLKTKLKKYLKKRTLPELITTYEDNEVYYGVFGYTSGKLKNTYELPNTEQSESKQLYDSISVISYEITEGPDDDNNENINPVSLTTEKWLNFYNGYSKEPEQENDFDEECEDDINNEVNEDEGICDDVCDESDDEILPEPFIKKKAQTANRTPQVIMNDIFPPYMENTNFNKFREATIVQLNFLKDLCFTTDDISNLEKSIFNYICTYADKNYITRNWKNPCFEYLYRNSVYMVLSNIHPESPVNNKRFLQRVLNKEFDLDAIPSMTSYEMYPENWKELADRQILIEQRNLEGDKSRATDQYKCHRCGKRECTYYELQTRSADEPMTIFITCLNCGKRWQQ